MILKVDASQVHGKRDQQMAPRSTHPYYAVCFWLLLSAASCSSCRESFRAAPLTSRQQVP